MKAYLIGETSAGMTAVEIWDGEDLLWSNCWFGDGGSERGYINGLFSAFECMAESASVYEYDGGDEDEFGEPVEYDSVKTTGVMLEYESKSGRWLAGEDFRVYGQSSEIIDAMMLSGLIPADQEHELHACKNVVMELAKMIEKEGYR